MAGVSESELELLNRFREDFLGDGGYVTAHTSGSTGVPKEIRLPKSDLRLSARATNAFFGIDGRSVLASPLSVGYIAGKMMVVRALEAGCTLLPLPVSNRISIPENCSRVDLLPVVPSQTESLLAQPRLAAVVRNVLIGGAAPSAEICQRLTDAGYRAWISYGMTETASHVALARADDSGRVFHALPGISFSVDVRGALVIHAPGRSFGSLTTNDAVELLSGAEFRWLGRLDNVINSGAVKIHPEELEALLEPAMGARAFYVTGRADARWGQVPVIVFEGRASEISVVLAAAERVIADRRRLPRAAVAVAAIPRTPNGKIKRAPGGGPEVRLD